MAVKLDMQVMKFRLMIGTSNEHMDDDGRPVRWSWLVDSLVDIQLF